MGVSRAAVSLRQMVGEQVLLSVPAVNIVTPRGSGRACGARQLPQAGCRAAILRRAVFRAGASDISGSAESGARALHCGREHSLEDVIDLEQEALAETGNVILNACLATIANVLRRSMRMSLPSVIRGDGATLFEIRSSDPDGDLVLFLYIDFTIKSRDVRGLHCATDGLAIDYGPEGNRG